MRTRFSRKGRKEWWLEFKIEREKETCPARLRRLEKEDRIHPGLTAGN